MGTLRQIQIRFVAEEDRLLLRLNAAGGTQLRFFLTRRLVQRVWPILVAALASNPQVSAHSDAAARATVLAFRQEQALAQVALGRPFEEEASELPLGEAALLVTRVRLRQRTPGVHVLGLHGAGGRGAHLTLDEMMLHALCRLLYDAVAGADWGLDLHLGQAAPPAVAGRIN
jgi:hypothetical protein